MKKFFMVGCYAFLLSGCSTVALDRVGLSKFKDSISATQLATMSSLEEANKQAAESGVQSVVVSGSEIPSGDWPTLAARPEDLDDWNLAFRGLEAYVATLKKLSESGLGASAGDELQSIADQFTGSGKFTSETKGLFGGLTKAYLERRTQRDVFRIMRATDAAFGEVVSKMSGAIGDICKAPEIANKTCVSGIRQAAQISHKNRLSQLRLRVTNARSVLNNEKEVERLLYVYGAAQSEARALDRSLMAATDALMLLKKTHLELSKGESLSATASLELLSATLDDIQNRMQKE